MATTKVNHPDLLDLASDTGATVFPKGTTAQRPVSPEAGYIRFNTTDNVMETYDGTEWLTLDSESWTPPVTSVLLVNKNASSIFHLLRYNSQTSSADNCSSSKIFVK